MKKALIISLVIFLVSAVAFGISIPLTGVREGQGFGISISSIPFLGTGTSFGTPLKAGDVKEYTFNKSVNDISIITTSAETTIVADGEGNAALTREIAFEKALYTASCKAAMKGGRKDGREHLEYLCKRLLALPDIRYCPHGRPVAFEISKGSIEHHFGRS